MKRLSDVSQKYNDSVVDNRILNADFETIKAKVSPWFNCFTSKTCYRIRNLLLDQYSLQIGMH